MAAAAAGALLLVGTSACQSSSTSTPPPSPPSGTATGSPSAPPTSGGPGTDPGRAVNRPAGDFPVGLALGNSLFTATPAELAADLDDARRAGARWIRIDLSWNSLQPTGPRRYDWAPLDRIMAGAARRHLRVLGILAYTPAWARARGCEAFTCPPADQAAFTTFAGAVARRYADSALSAYEVWNEPNLPEWWISPSPTAYGRLLKATTAAVHREAPTVPVVFGGLGPNAGDGAIPAPLFLRRACAAGACADIDGVGVQPYTFPQSPEEKSRPPTAWQRMTVSSPGVPSITSTLADLGLSRLPIWITAYGAPTAGGSPTAADGPGAPDSDHVTDGWQATLVRQAVTDAGAETSLFAGVFVYTLDDTDETSVTGSFGLRRTDGTAKPAYAAFREASHQLR